MDFYSAMELIASGMGAERVRMNTTASNLANAKTTRTAEGGPYKRLDAVVSAKPIKGDAFADALDAAIAGVEVVNVQQDQADPRLVYDPGHPDANGEGYVAYPNINLVEEMTNMITAGRAYEAGVTAMSSVVEMARRALNVGK